MPDIANVFGQQEFTVRRLHSLLGIVPVGAFLAVHLLTNAAVLDGSYQARVDQIHSLGPLTLLAVEWGLIFLPILFHGIVGLIIVARGKRNLRYYAYRENFRYSLQRWTGVIAFVFIIWHVFATRGWITFEWWVTHVTRPLGGGAFDAKMALVTSAAAIQSSTPVAILYLVGVLASVYHFSDGIWTAGITWGVWSSANAQRWANWIALLVGLGLGAIGLAALWGMRVAVLT
jgi:succinate dehydrogenase / fumarate reductase, cytochrome b subunit